MIMIILVTAAHRDVQAGRQAGGQETSHTRADRKVQSLSDYY